MHLTFTINDFNVDSVVTGSEKEQVESHKNLLCLDDDVDLLYSLLKKSELTKGKAKKLDKLTVNLDSGIRKSIALERSRLLYFDAEDGKSAKKDKKLLESLEKNQGLPKPAEKVVIVKKDKELPKPAGKVIHDYINKKKLD